MRQTIFVSRLRKLAAHLETAGAEAVPAARQAYGLLYQSVIRQATLLAYIDTFAVRAVGEALMFLVSFFLKKNDLGGGRVVMEQAARGPGTKPVRGQRPMIRVITVEREYGSGGAEIAGKVAKRMGWKLWDQLLTNEIAREMECDCRVVEEHEEKRDPLYYRLMRAFMRGSYEGSLNEPRLRIADTACIRAVAERVVKAAAREGECVIVGRGSAYYLKDLPEAFHVFIYAPFDEKVRRLEAGGKSESEAVQLVESVDLDRAEFIKEYFQVEWPDRQKFHLMVNSTIGEDAAVETILNGIAQFEKERASAAVPAPQKGGR